MGKMVFIEITGQLLSGGICEKYEGEKTIITLYNKEIEEGNRNKIAYIFFCKYLYKNKV